MRDNYICKTLTCYCPFLHCSYASLITVDATEYCTDAESHRLDTDQANRAEYLHAYKNMLKHQQQQQSSNEKALRFYAFLIT